MSSNIYPLQIIGSMTIFTDPPGATVYIDNVIQPDTTPIIVAGLLEGNHIYKLVLVGYQDIVGMITINDTTPSYYIHEDFQPYPSIGLQENVLLPALGLAVGIVAAEYIIRKYMSKSGTT